MSRSARKKIKVYVFNSQNSTPDVAAQVDRGQERPASRSRAVTETLSPASASFQDWQSTQLQALEAALAAGDREVSADHRRSADVDAEPGRAGPAAGLPGAGGVAGPASPRGVGGRAVWSRRDACRSGRASSSRCSARTGSASPRCSR